MNRVHKSFFEIASAVDDILGQLDRVQNLTNLFDEHLETELNSLEERPELAPAFLARAPMLNALLFTIEQTMSNMSSDLQDLSEQAMESHKATKGGDSQ